MSARGRHGLRLDTAILPATALILPDNPIPVVGGPFIIDTRAGGAQDITGAANLAAAELASGFSHQGGPNPIAFTTTLEKNASGRAWRRDWAANVVNNCFFNRAGLDFGGVLCVQYKVWYGRTALGGGVGTVADYDQHIGHKFEVFFFRSKTGGASTNDNRHTWLWDSTLGFRVTIDGYIVAAANGLAGSTTTVINTDGNFAANAFNGLTLEVWDGTGSVTTGTIQSSTAGPNSVFTLTAALGVAPDATSKLRIRDDTSGQSPPPSWGVGNYSQDASIPTGNPNPGGITPITNMQNLINQVVTHSIRVTPESTPGAKDGKYERWINGSKVFNIVSPVGRFGAPPLRWKEWQSSPTWNDGPQRDCSDYIWDVVISQSFTNV